MQEMKRAVRQADRVKGVLERAPHSRGGMSLHQGTSTQASGSFKVLAHRD